MDMSSVARGENLYTEEEILQDIKQVAEKLGKSPTRSEYREHGSISTATIRDRLGSWNKAKKQANLKAYTKGKEKLKIPDNRSWKKDEWEDLSTSRRMAETKKSYLGKYKIDRGCYKCGYDESPAALELHHVNKEEKSDGTTEWIGRGWDWIENELSKVRVLCSNCHHIEHWDDGRWDTKS